MSDKVLLFHIEDEAIQLRIEMALFMNQVGIKRIEKKDYLQTIGYLAGVEDAKATEIVYEGEELEDPMMILCMDSDKIDTVLAAFRQMGVPRINYKAMLTPTNATWTPLALYQELKREHEAFQNR